MFLLLDIGNTHTHLGLADRRKILRHADLPTALWKERRTPHTLLDFVGSRKLEGAILSSVVPRATPVAKRYLKRGWNVDCLELTAATVRGLGVDYPHPETLGADRLANAVAARHHFGAPCVAVDFGTALTLDVVDDRGNFTGGIIAPGLALMTQYLHEKTALLPAVEWQPTAAVIGKSTAEAMRIGAGVGFRGLVRELLQELQQILRTRRLPIVATGGYAALVAGEIPEITAVDPLLTLEGLRLSFLGHSAETTLLPMPARRQGRSTTKRPTSTPIPKAAPMKG